MPSYRKSRERRREAQRRSAKQEARFEREITAIENRHLPTFAPGDDDYTAQWISEDDE